MRTLTLKEEGNVQGAGWFTVWMNSRSARKTCGEGNVKTVTNEGFECKVDPEG